MPISNILKHAPYDGCCRVTTVNYALLKYYSIPYSALKRSVSALCQGRHNPGFVMLR